MPFISPIKKGSDPHSIWRKYHSLCERNPIKYQSSKRAGSGQQNKICGTLRLGFFLKLFPLPASAILKEYTDKYPDVDVQITTGQSSSFFSF